MIKNTAASASTLRYLDILGNELTYTLINGQIVTQTFLTGFTKAFLFQYTSGSSKVFVAVPIVDNNAAVTN
jgi:hypothetical protein